MRIFITGVSSGIGRELALMALSEGHEVFGIGRSSERLEILHALAGVDSPKLETMVCDVSKFSDIDSVAARLEGMLFYPDAVILNAAIDLEDPFPEFSKDSFSKSIDTNLTGALAWVDCFLPKMLEREAGQFVAISSLLALWPDETSPGYAASKAGLSMAFRSLKQRHRSQAVSFKTLVLGPVDTNINPRFKDEAGARKLLLVASPSAAARKIIKMIKGHEGNHYFPLYVGFVSRLLFWLPDGLFEILTRPWRR